MGFEDGERLAIIVDFPVPDLVAELRTDFLLAIHRGDADLRAHVLAEITRRAGTGSDPFVAAEVFSDELLAAGRHAMARAVHDTCRAVLPPPSPPPN